MQVGDILGCAGRLQIPVLGDELLTAGEFVFIDHLKQGEQFAQVVLQRDKQQTEKRRSERERHSRPLKDARVCLLRT